MKNTINGLEIAIIGMSGQFPESNNCTEFWKNLENGKEMLKTFTEEELIRSGVPEYEFSDPNFVRTQGVLNNKNFFDHGFFEYSPDEAALMDPQIRLFHEHCWKALEDSGYSSKTDTQKIGLFAGASNNQNWQVYVAGKSTNSFIDPFFIDKISDRAFISTLVSYKLNLRGPSYYLDTACSTSLAAIHMACRSLLTQECSIAMAGAVFVNTVKAKGYTYVEGGVASIDGRCRAFDINANGTAAGEGLGVLVLKRMNDAVKDRDHIYAIIKSTAANNDGNRKVGYTAPSVNGQVDCIKMAHKLAAVDASSISYIETHGTGTKLGDPIEIKSLNEAFNLKDAEKFCAIGSVKTNIGHLDSSAGVAGVIKVALSLKNKKIPASLNFTQPNPGIDFNEGPFFVNSKLKEWNRLGNHPLRAGVSSFGIGGTNIHAVLEEAPEAVRLQAGMKYKLFLLSAKSKASLLRSLSEFNEFLERENDLDLNDMAYTLNVGRKHFGYRKSILFSEKGDLLENLRPDKHEKNITRSKFSENSVVFMFSGAGSQYPNMGKALYENNPLFRSEMDKGFAVLSKITKYNYSSVLYPSDSNDFIINQMIHTQPAIFIFGYSLAKLLMNYGINPVNMIGHSIGEYIAACISGVFTFEDAIKLVVKRGELMNAMPEGAMISVAISEKEALAYLNDTISLAAVNGPEQVVFSGDNTSIEKLILEFKKTDISCVKLYTSHAGHSHAIENILKEYEDEFKNITLSPPKIPFVSNLTGKFISENEACSINYWIDHMRHTVRFSDGLDSLLNHSKDRVFIELGGGHSLTSLLRQRQSKEFKPITYNLIRHAKEDKNDEEHFVDNLGNLWTQGVNVDWEKFYAEEKRNKVSLPTYSFEPYKYLAEVDGYDLISASTGEGLKKNINDWFYSMIWKQSLWLPTPININNEIILIFSNDDFLFKKLEEHYISTGNKCIRIVDGSNYRKIEENLYAIDYCSIIDVDKLFYDLQCSNICPNKIIHALNYEEAFLGENELRSFDYYQKIGYNSILEIVRKFTTYFSSNNLKLEIIANGLYNVFGNELLCPEKTTLLGVVKVIPLEFFNITCRAIDVIDKTDSTIECLLKELDHPIEVNEVAIRGKIRYIKDFEKIDFKYNEESDCPKMKGTYLITGASGGMGRIFSEYIAKNFQANLLLIGRNDMTQDEILRLNNFGSKVLYIKCDISNMTLISSAIAEAESKFGNINGVIHTAGVADFGGIILRRSEEDDCKVFSAKVIGTKVLDTIFENKQLDFFINCSSQNASIPSFGQVAYVASNIYQDSIALNANRNYPVISIEWTALKNVGMAVNAFSHLSLKEQEERLAQGLSPDEAAEVLMRCIYLKVPVQVISKNDFKREFFNNNKQEELEKYLDPDKLMDPTDVLERPLLSTEYKDPETNTQRELKVIFENFFGIESIGINDNFFELGGDSLKALGLLLWIKKVVNVNIGLSVFFKNPSIKQLADEIDDMKSLLVNKSDLVTKRKLTI